MSDVTPMIIDTDPGVDDAMAIFYALAEPRIDLLGLTTVFGNVSVERATRNALQLLEIADASAPVAGGDGRALRREPAAFPDFVHGVEGFGNEVLPPPAASAVDEDAADFLIRSFKERPGEITLAAIGPLTNLARALERDSSIARDVKQLVIMGGAVRTAGNVTQYAEANIWNDPDAAAQVFAAEWPVTLVGLDVTQITQLPRGALEPMAKLSPKTGAFLARATDYYVDFHQERRGVDACFLHDPAAIIAAIEPTLFTTEEMSVRVGVDGEEIGGVFPEPDGEGNARISACVAVKDDKVVDVFLSALMAGRLP